MTASDNKITKDAVIDALRRVTDPELGIDVWTLGLVYDISLADDGVDIVMTLTSPMCPFADELIASVEREVGALFDGREGSVRVDITFDPPWEPSDELRTMLGV